jgi:hypothetical protein
MLVNVLWLIERREAMPLMAEENPEAKPRSRATLRSRVAVMALDGGESGEKRALSAYAVACAARAHAFGFVRTTARSCVPRMRIESKYLSWINTHIKPKWRDVPIAMVKPLPVELWVNNLKLTGKSKGHIREMMHLLFN